MLHLALLTTALMFSVSVRTPKEMPNSLDYEIASGIEMGKENHAELWGWTERQNGKYYKGAEGKICLNNSFMENSIFGEYRQDRDVERVGILSQFKLLKYGRAGFGNVWDHEVPAVTANIGAKALKTQISAAFYKKGVESVRAEISHDFEAVKYISLTPLFKYTRDRMGTEYVQGKMVFKIRANP